MCSINILHINVNGLTAKRTELGLYLAESNPDIICLNETKINRKTYPDFKGYALASMRDRSINSDKHQGGGVAIYTRSNIVHEDISPDLDDIAAIRFKLGNVEYAVMAYYCTPGLNKLDTKILSSYCDRYANFIIMGDLNAKHQFYGSSQSDTRGDTLFDFVEKYDMMVANRWLPS